MSVRGVRQLKNLLIRYSDLDGSSKGVRFVLLCVLNPFCPLLYRPICREWIRTTLIPFAESNPDLKIQTELKRSRHPYLCGKYLNGNQKLIDIKNLSVEEIDSYVMDLRNQIGRKVSYVSTESIICHASEIACGQQIGVAS